MNENTYAWATWTVRKERAGKESKTPGQPVVVLRLENPAAQKKACFTFRAGEDLSGFWRGPGCSVPGGAVTATEKALDDLNKVARTGG